VTPAPDWAGMFLACAAWVVGLSVASWVALWGMDSAVNLKRDEKEGEDGQ
jgi:hypothetical protein